MIGFPDGSVERSAIEGEGRGAGIEPGAAIQLENRPGHQALFGEELGESAGVPGNSKRLVGRPTRGLMLAMSVARGAAEDRDDDLRPKPANDSDYILENRVPGPVLPGFVHRLGKTEIIGPGEVLAGAIQTPRGQQLLGPQQAQGLSQLWADEILAALAPVERQIGSLRSHSSDQDRE